MQPVEPQVVYHRVAATVNPSLIFALFPSAVCAAQWLAAPLYAVNVLDDEVSRDGV
jgi:hypothetical protein